MGRAMVARLGLGLLLLALLLPTQVRPWRPRGSGAAPEGGAEPPPGYRPAPPARAADWGAERESRIIRPEGGHRGAHFPLPGGLPPPSRGPGNNAPPRVGREARALPQVPRSCFPGRLAPTTRFLPEVRGTGGEENVSFPPLERPEISGCSGRASRFPPGVSSRPPRTTQRGDDPLRGRRSHPSSPQLVRGSRGSPAFQALLTHPSPAWFPAEARAGTHS